MRFHSDIEKSFLGDVHAFIEDKAWLKTTTEGYDSNGNSIVERRNKKLNQALRGMLIDATGGRLYYEELWDAAMDHAHDIISHMWLSRLKYRNYDILFYCTNRVEAYPSSRLHYSKSKSEKCIDSTFKPAQPHMVRTTKKIC